jgi:CMP-N,N'-diacetyllegionaminic acid synthase
MIQGKSVLGIITARGGSKGFPGKNIANLAGKPLIAYTIEAGKKSKYIDRLILSSEDEDIIEVARDFGCEVPFIRPTELALDTTPGIDPVLHAIAAINEIFDFVVLLQPTSPLRISEDIDAAIEKCLISHPACVSVCEPDKSPYWMYSITEKDKMVPLLETKAYRRQDLPKVYAINGAIYVSDTEYLMKHKTFVTEDTVAYIMPKIRSIDVDSEIDLKLCELIINEKIED